MMETTTVRMPGKVFDACFDPMATDVPRESGWPEARAERRGRGYTMVYEVTYDQLADMIDHARTWGEGLSFGVDPETAAEARAVLRWVADCDRTEAEYAERFAPRP